MRRKIKYFFINLIEGVYSGIPLCCIVSYCKGRDGYKAAEEHSFSAEDYYKRYPAEYVQCQSCEEKKRAVEIRHNGRLF